MSRIQLHGVLKYTALASSAVVEQLEAVAGLDITAFMPCGAEPGTASTIEIEKQFAILAKLLLLVFGREFTLGGGKAWVEKLREAFLDGVKLITSHGEANHQAIQRPVHQARKQGLSTEVHGAALCARSNWHEPPEIDELLGAELPTWAKVGAYIDAGRMAHVAIHRDPVALLENGGRTVERPRRDEDIAQLP